MSHYATHLAGKSYGKLGVAMLTPPEIAITGYATVHALHRAVGRDITTKERYETVKDPLLVLEQAEGYSYLFLSEQGVVVLTHGGEVRTTYGANDFDATIQQILHEALGR
jgi:hypothetical protein